MHLHSVQPLVPLVQRTAHSFQPQIVRIEEVHVLLELAMRLPSSVQEQCIPIVVLVGVDSRMVKAQRNRRDSS